MSTATGEQAALALRWRVGPCRTRGASRYNRPVLKRARCVVHGLVQGVSFRACTRREAVRRGLVGWVKNLADGGVEFVAEGEERLVDELIAWARRGPDFARVDDVEVRWEPPAGERGFDVRYE